jgi:hypothetical protein
MPYSKRTCGDADCSRIWEPHTAIDAQEGICRGCRWKRAKESGAAQLTPYHLRDCHVCARQFQAKGDQVRCPGCVKLAQTARGKDDPERQDHYLASPLVQAVFDLETWSLDRGWGVLMVGSILVHGEGPEPTWYDFDLTQSSGWPDRRSDDSELAEKILGVLRRCHVLYAHNGARYDVPWLNSIALKYGLPSLRAKLIDPVQVARNKYRIGSNSLSAMSNFLGLEENKMPLAPEVWRLALLDNDPASWALLRERCRSDVRILNTVASKVTRDVGMIDHRGSAWG